MHFFLLEVTFDVKNNKYYIQLFSELESEHSTETQPDEDLMYKSTRMDEYIETLYYHLPNKVYDNNIQQEKYLLAGEINPFFIFIYH